MAAAMKTPAGRQAAPAPLKYRLSSTGYLSRDKKGALNIRKAIFHRYSLMIDNILAIKSKADFLRDGICLTETG